MTDGNPRENISVMERWLQVSYCYLWFFKRKHCKEFKTIKRRTHKLNDKCYAIIHAFFTARSQFKIRLQCKNQILDEKSPFGVSLMSRGEAHSV